jgi:hypothetical protein
MIAPSKKARKACKQDAINRIHLANVFVTAAERAGLTSRNELGKKVEDAPSQMSRVFNGHVDELSADRYVKHLNSLGYNVDVTVSKAAGPKGRTRVIWS